MCVYICVLGCTDFRDLEIRIIFALKLEPCEHYNNKSSALQI